MNKLIFSSDFLVLSLNVSFLCSTTAWGIFVCIVVACDGVYLLFSAFIAAGDRKKFSISALCEARWEKGLNEPFIHSCRNVFCSLPASGTLHRARSFLKICLIVVRDAFAETRGEGIKPTHPIFVARIQDVNCVLLGNYATFHNKSVWRGRKKKARNEWWLQWEESLFKAIEK